MGSKPSRFADRFGRGAGRFVTMLEPERHEPRPDDEVILEWTDGPESNIAFDRFPPNVTAPAAIALIIRRPHATSVVQLEYDGRDEHNRPTYAKASPETTKPMPVSCSACRSTDANRLYAHRRLWWCRRCWLEMLGIPAAAPASPPPTTI